MIIIVTTANNTKYLKIETFPNAHEINVILLPDYELTARKSTEFAGHIGDASPMDCLPFVN
jgi:hypothetical protein